MQFPIRHVIGQKGKNYRKRLQIVTEDSTRFLAGLAASGLDQPVHVRQHSSQERVFGELRLL